MTAAARKIVEIPSAAVLFGRLFPVVGGFLGLGRGEQPGQYARGRGAVRVFVMFTIVDATLRLLKGNVGQRSGH